MPWRLKHGKEMSNLIFETYLVVAARCTGWLRFHFSTEHATVAVDIYQQKE